MKNYYETPNTLEGIIRELNFIKESGKIEHIADLIQDIDWMMKEESNISLEKWNKLNEEHASLAYEHNELKIEHDQLQSNYDDLVNGVEDEF